MVRIAVIGSNEFVVGFHLAGIKNVVETGDNPFREVKALIDKKDAGVVVIEEDVLNRMDAQQKNLLQNSVEPVFIPLSAKSEQDGLKKLIKKSIGVDLWK